MNNLTKQNNTKFHFGIITLFPKIFDSLNHSITGRAINSEIIKLNFWDLIKIAKENNERPDDRPYGGGPGMIIRYEPLKTAILDAKKALGPKTKVIYLSPQGKVLNQPKIKALSSQERLILIAGRYEGIDERIIDKYVDEEISIGDYVLSGGEHASMILIDAITRLLPGALGNDDSQLFDSFSNGLLDCPHYTRPKSIEDLDVPEVLLNGNHKAITNWQIKQALGYTWLKRPDLLDDYPLSTLENNLLDEFKSEYMSKIEQHQNDD